MRQRLNPRRGATLIEAMVATVVIAAGTAAVTELLKYVSEASRRMAFQSTALDVYGEVTAYLEDARCNVILPAGTQRFDPLIQALVPGGPTGSDWRWLTRTNGRLEIAAVGPPNAPVFTGIAQGTAPVWVGIRRIGAPAPLTAPSPPAFTFEIQVREVMHDAARDNPANTSGFWIRILPTKKVCTFRDEDDARGEL